VASIADWSVKGNILNFKTVDERMYLRIKKFFKLQAVKEENEEM